MNDGKLNKTIWTTYAGNPWDKRTHFTTNNLHFADGKAILRYEKKTGPINDDPTKGTTDYASVLLSTFDHWTQRYGYFEARMKLPRAAGVWPAFWMMPTEENPYGQWPKCGEIDIAEVLADRTEEI